MSYSEELKNAAKVLAKQGKAFVTINLVPYANDLDFPRDPPSCRVTVTARDPGDNNRVVQTESADIPTTKSPYVLVVEIKVQTTVKSLGRFVGFPQYRALNIDVRADPIGGYEQWYDVDSSVKDLVVKVGSTESRNVSLKPKYEGSRLEKPDNLLKKKVLPRPPEA